MIVINALDDSFSEDEELEILFQILQDFPSFLRPFNFSSPPAILDIIVRYNRPALLIFKP